MDRGEIVKALGPRLARPELDVVAAYVFGSVARGDDRPDSDVDVGIWLRSTPPATVAGAAVAPMLADDLTSDLGRKVDVVILNRAPLELVHRVLRDSFLIVERDRSSRVAFEVAFRRDYLDMLPYLRQYRRQPGRAA